MPKRGAAAAANQRKVGGRPDGDGSGTPSPTDASPSLPLLRTSERSTLKTCEWRWDLEYNQLRKPLVSQPALRFGSLVHKAMAGYYVIGKKRGVHPARGFEKAYDEEQAYVQEKFGARVKDLNGDEKWVEARKLGVAMMENYVDEYGADRDWEVLATEQPFQVVVLHPKTGEPWFVYVGVMDGIWRKISDRTLWIPDHKSTASLGDNKLNYLQMDDQAGSYWSFGVDWMIKAAFLKKHSELSGMLYNFLRKALPDERASKYVGGKRLYLNLDGSISKKQPSPYFHRELIFRDEYDREQTRRRAMIDFTRIGHFRAGRLDISKTPGQFTCPSCWARDACELHETGADYVSFIEETTRPWNPYEEHEVYDGR